MHRVEIVAYTASISLVFGGLIIKNHIGHKNRIFNCRWSKKIVDVSQMVFNFTILELLAFRSLSGKGDYLWNNSLVMTHNFAVKNIILYFNNCTNCGRLRYPQGRKTYNLFSINKIYFR